MTMASPHLHFAFHREISIRSAGYLSLVTCGFLLDSYSEKTKAAFCLIRHESHKFVQILVQLPSITGHRRFDLLSTGYLSLVQQWNSFKTALLICWPCRYASPPSLWTSLFMTYVNGWHGIMSWVILCCLQYACRCFKEDIMQDIWGQKDEKPSP